MPYHVDERIISFSLCSGRVSNCDIFFFLPSSLHEKQINSFCLKHFPHDADLNSYQVDEESEHSSQKLVLEHLKHSLFSKHRENCPLPVCSFSLVFGELGLFGLWVFLLFQITISSYLNKSELGRFYSKTSCGLQNFSWHTDTLSQEIQFS